MLMCCGFFRDYSRIQTAEVQEEFKVSNLPNPIFQRGKVLWFSKTTNQERQVNRAFHLALYTRGAFASLLL
jgi:hypothetical protein